MDFKDWYRAHTGLDFTISTHRATVLCENLSKIFGVTVTSDPHFVSQSCLWCNEIGHTTKFRITAAKPREDVDVPIDQVEVCGDCAEAVAKHIRNEQDPECDADIKIEVAL
jgi:hypothetical protein